MKRHIAWISGVLVVAALVSTSILAPGTLINLWRSTSDSVEVWAYGSTKKSLASSAANALDLPIANTQKVSETQDDTESGKETDTLNTDKDGADSSSGKTESSGRSSDRDATSSDNSSSNSTSSVDPDNSAAVIPPLPKCNVADDPAPYGDIDSWQFTLLDHQYTLSEDYAPKDLVQISSLGLKGEGEIREVVAQDLAALITAAKKAGSPIEVHSAYRSYATQVITFDSWVATSGAKHAAVSSARAGHSEHQLGTSIDVRSAGTAAPWGNGDWGDTKAGKWMAKNAWKYGFVMSFPEGQTDKTCYMYEAWHFRYIGADMALVVEQSGLTLREFMWNNAIETGALKP